MENLLVSNITSGCIKTCESLLIVLNKEKIWIKKKYELRKKYGLGKNIDYEKNMD